MHTPCILCNYSTHVECLRSITELQTGIPGIVGAIDGTHISIRKPCRNGEAYFNRKSFYSLNVQGTKPCQGFIANVTSYVSEVGVRVLRECYDEGGDRRSLNGNVTKTECTKAEGQTKVINVLNNDAWQTKT